MLVLDPMMATPPNTGVRSFSSLGRDAVDEASPEVGHVYTRVVVYLEVDKAVGSAAGDGWS